MTNEIFRKMSRVAAAAIIGTASSVSGVGRATAQEAEPTAIFSQDCPSGGYGVLNVDWTGPFPYDVTAESVIGRKDFSRGEANKASFDFSGVTYLPGREGPSVAYSLAYKSDASAAERMRKHFMTFYPSPCPQ